VSEPVGPETIVRLEAILAGIPYAAYLDVKVSSSAEGLVSRLPFRQDLVGNPHLPAIHGGVVGSFMEMAALVDLLSRRREDDRDTPIPKPINFNVNYLRSARPQDLHARVRIVKHGKRIANVEVRAWQDDETKPVASGWGNFLLMSDGR
jgi:acyl-coenzyme A thioesterase PaaI-like protein